MKLNKINLNDELSNMQDDLIYHLLSVDNKEKLLKVKEEEKRLKKKSFLKIGTLGLAFSLFFIVALTVLFNSPNNIEFESSSDERVPDMHEGIMNTLPPSRITTNKVEAERYLGMIVPDFKNVLNYELSESVKKIIINYEDGSVLEIADLYDNLEISNYTLDNNEIMNNNIIIYVSDYNFYKFANFEYNNFYYSYKSNNDNFDNDINELIKKVTEN